MDPQRWDRVKCFEISKMLSLPQGMVSTWVAVKAKNPSMEIKKVIPMRPEQLRLLQDHFE